MVSFSILILSHCTFLNSNSLVLRHRRSGHCQTLARFCLDHKPNGEPSGSEIYNLISESQLAHYIDFTPTKPVESRGTRSTLSKTRASPSELLENRIRAVRSDPKNVLNRRFVFSGRSFHFLGNFKEFF